MAASTSKPGRLYVVATPIGNLDDISARALQTLRAVPLILAEDTRHSQRLLQHYGIASELSSLHEHNERERTPAIIKRLLAGDDIALISDAGTPLLSDPGYVLIKAASEQGITISPVPGASAITAALSAAGLPTHRFVFEGFLPAKQSARRQALEGFKHETGVTVLFESTHRIADLLQDIRAVLGGERELVLARELTKLHETFLRGSTDQIIEVLTNQAEQHRGEFVVLIAPGVELPSDEQALQHCLQVLLAELPLKQAVQLAAQITGVKRNRVYELALALAETDT
jgi:16S rRNA (cytidine1402-2'-O)-methyltransferase